MAKLNTFFCFMLFLFATSIVTSAVEPETIEETYTAPVPDGYAPPPEYDYYIDYDHDYEDEVAIPPQPSPEKLKFLNECLSKMIPECAKEVFMYMFEDLVVSKHCCEVLVDMGEPCHISLVKTIFSIPEYKADASLGIPRSKQVWNKCALALAPHAYPPVAFENYSKN
ncbi:hypothetical protein DITRI_Ditri10aG0174900 [Diplodiscus trichospermus]